MLRCRYLYFVLYGTELFLRARLLCIVRTCIMGYQLLAKIKKHFKGFPAQWKVAKLLLERGFQVSNDGKIISGQIQVAQSQIAKEAEVGRRAVIRSMNRILSVPELRRIYTNLRQVCSLIDVAPELGLSTVILVPRDALKRGVLARIAAEFALEKVNILQAFAEHPSMSEEPKLIVVLEGKISTGLVNRLRQNPDVRSITIR